MAIAMIPVVSSQIAASCELVIRFHGCGRAEPAIYSYAGVPSALAQGLIAAASPGAYFHRHIRHGHFPYRRVECGEAES